MARDGILPGSSFLARVHKGSGAPVFAIGFVTVVAIAVTLIAQKLSTVTSVASIYYALVYLILTLVYLARRNKLPSPEGAFSLGRAGVPIMVAVSLFMIFIALSLTVPQINHSATFASLVFLGITAVAYLGVFRKLRTLPKDSGALAGCAHVGGRADRYRRQGVIVEGP